MRFLTSGTWLRTVPPYERLVLKELYFLQRVSI